MKRLILGSAIAATMSDMWRDIDLFIPQQQPVTRERIGKTGAAKFKRQAKKRRNIRARSRK